MRRVVYLLGSVLVTSLATGLALISIFTLGFCPLTYSLPLLIPLFFSFGFLSGMRYGKEASEGKNLVKGLEGDERRIVEILLAKGGKAFQREIAREIGAVRTTRALKKLEAKGIVKRERIGKVNLVILQ